MASNDFGLRTINGSDFDNPQRLYDVVVIHGLYGSSHSSWTDIEWEVEFLPSLGGGSACPRLSLYTYDVFGSNGGILTRGGAKAEATKLLNSLLELRGNRSKNMPITFVVHDLGGSLMKEAVVLAQQRKYEDIYTSIVLMVFLGCPHQGPKIDLQTGCADLLMSHQKTTYPEAWELSGPLVEWVQETNDLFAETRISAIVTMYTGVSVHPDPRERVFDKSATSILAKAELFATSLGHKSLLKHPILSSLEKSFGQREYHSNAVFRRHINNFAAQVPPQYPIDTAPLNKEQPDLCAARQAFLEFINSDGAGRWVVHALDSPGCSATDTAEQVLKWIVDLAQQHPSAESAFFSFDANDAHSDSAEAALSNFLVELCSRCHPEEKEITQKALEPLNICQNIQVEDLYTAYVGLVLRKLSLWRGRSTTPSEATFTIVLGNLDGRIRNGAWLFKNLEDIVHDCGLRFKVVVTSSDPASLTSDLGSAITVGLAPDIKPPALPSSGLGLASNPYMRDEKPNRPESEAGVRNISDGAMVGDGQDENMAVLKSVLDLIQGRPLFYSYSGTLSLLAQSCRKDKRLWEMIINWLKDVQLPSEDQWQDYLSQLIPATPNKLFESMLTSMPSQARPLFIILLEQVLFAFRPLTLSELLDLELSNSPDQPQHGHPGSFIKRGAAEGLCGGLLTIRRKEVHLAHPKLRSFLLTATKETVGGWLRLGSEASINGRIAMACLDYLASPKRRQLLEHRAGPGSRHTSFECKDDFLSYAVKHWLPHATRAGKEIFRSDACTRFLADSDAVRLWATLYQELSPAVASQCMPSVNILASLVIFAEHGAEDLLILFAKKHQELKTPDLDCGCFAALVTAAGLGNIRMVRELLKFHLPEGETLDKPILAAIESGNKDVFVEIIERKTNGGIQDFTSLLARAASLGRTDFTKQLLDKMGTSGVEISSSRNASPLNYACQRGYGEVVELLIREGGPTIISELEVKHDTSLPIQLAVQFGKTDILDILRSAVAKRPEDSAAIKYYRSVFTESSIFSRRQPIRNILDYVYHHLPPKTGTHISGEMDVSQEVDEANIVIRYLCQKLMDYSEFSNYPIGPINEIIKKWPHAIEIVNFLTEPKRSILRDPRFPSYFEGWMVAAVRSGDIAVVKLLFENGYKSPLATDQVLEHVATVSFRAALERQFTVCMKYAIEKGANFTSYWTLYEQSPLFNAAYYGLVAAVKVLIKVEVDVNAKGDEDWFPIHACYDNVDITRLLIAAGADIDVLTTPRLGEGRPSMWFSVISHYPEVVDELLKANPSPKTLQCGLKAAIEAKMPDMIEKLLCHCPNASYLPDVDNLLHIAVNTSNLKNLQLLLSQRYQLDVDKKDSHGNTALHCIEADTSPEAVELLITHGASIELVNDQGYTPLTVAAYAPNTSVVQCLLEHGANVNILDGLGDGPFLWACHKGTVDMVKAMHTRNIDPADVNFPPSRSGMMGTPLNAVLLRRDETTDKQEIIQYLLEEGHAEINVRSMLWSGALQVACLTSNVETVRMLIEQYHANVNNEDDNGRTPLHMALYRTREHVELLLEHGAKWDAVDITKRNALHFAVLSGKLDVVSMVLNNRPTFVDRQDAHGWTPLLWALRVTGRWGAQTSEMRAIVQELFTGRARRLQRGQGFDRTWTPMTIAKYYSVSEEVRELLVPTPEDFDSMSDDDLEWNWNTGGGKRGIINTNEHAWCDHCLLGFCGLAYECVERGCDVCYCLHCYQSSNKLHALGHPESLQKWGQEEDISSDAGGDSSSDEGASRLGTEPDEQLEVEENGEQMEE